MVRAARDFNRPAAGLHDGFRDGEAEPGATGGARFVGAVKALEDVRQVSGGNAGAGVADGEGGRAVAAFCGDADFAAVVVVVDGVGQEVRDDLGEAVGVALAPVVGN